MIFTAFSVKSGGIFPLYPQTPLILPPMLGDDFLKHYDFCWFMEALEDEWNVVIKAYKFTIFQCIIIHCTLIPRLCPYMTFVVAEGGENLGIRLRVLCTIPTYRVYQIPGSFTFLAVLSSGHHSRYTSVAACYCAAWSLNADCWSFTNDSHFVVFSIRVLFEHQKCIQGWSHLAVQKGCPKQRVTIQKQTNNRVQAPTELTISKQLQRVEEI